MGVTLPRSVPVPCGAASRGSNERLAEFTPPADVRQPDGFLPVGRCTMIVIDDFFDRMARLRAQFRLAQTAIEGWGQSEEVLKRYAQDEFDDIRENIHKQLTMEGRGQDGHWIFTDQTWIDDYLGMVRTETSRQIGGVRGRLVQYEYVLVVTFFETFMRDAHREILRANPHLLKADRHVELGRLISQGQEGVIRAEIERAVQTLDRESVKKKANYFQNQLGIDWTWGGHAVSLLEKVVGVRNTILHEDADREISDLDLGVATAVCTSVALAANLGAAVLYPNVCTLPSGVPETEARKYFTIPQWTSP